MAKKTNSNKPPLAVDNQGVFIPKEVRNPILEAESHEWKLGRMSKMGKGRPHPAINITEVD